MTIAIPGATGTLTAAATAAGTAYEVTDFRPLNATTDLARAWVPTSVPNGASATVVVYAHGYAAGRGDPDNADRLHLRNAVLDRGWVLIAADAHGDAWANQTALDDYQRAAQAAANVWTVQHVLLVGLSMGGLTAASLYGKDMIPNVRGAMLIDAAVNLDTMLGQYAASIYTAYGATAGDFQTKSAGYSPYELPTSAFAGKRLRLAASYSDGVVSRTDNADAFAARFAPVAVECSVANTGGAHVAAVNIVPADVLAFCDRALGAAPAPAPAASGWSAPVVEQWNGTAWVTPIVEQWNGAAWVTPVVERAT